MGSAKMFALIMVSMPGISDTEVGSDVGERIEVGGSTALSVGDLVSGSPASSTGRPVVCGSLSDRVGRIWRVQLDAVLISTLTVWSVGKSILPVAPPLVRVRVRLDREGTLWVDDVFRGSPPEACELVMVFKEVGR